MRFPFVQFFGRDHVDDLLRKPVDLDHQPVHAADKEHVENRGGNGHGQSAGRVQQGLGDAAGQQFGPPSASAAAIALNVWIMPSTVPISPNNGPTVATP